MKTKKTTLMFGMAIVYTTLLGGWVVTPSHAAADATAMRQAPDDELQRLLTARLDSATKALRIERDKLASGRTTFQVVCQAAQCLLAAQLDLSATAEERVAALTNQVALMRQLEQEAAKRLEAGILPVGDDEVVRYWRLTAEVELLRAKRVATSTK
jgi:hypothetical protein